MCHPPGAEGGYRASGLVQRRFSTRPKLELCPAPESKTHLSSNGDIRETRADAREPAPEDDALLQQQLRARDDFDRLSSRPKIDAARLIL
jgi:hypothetical protein